jgi:hypothetical protein
MIAFITTSTLKNFLTNKHKTNIYEQNGVYKITCQSCYKVYMYRTNGKKPKIKIQITLKKYKKQERRIGICPAYNEHGPSVRTHGANHENGRGEDEEYKRKLLHLSIILEQKHAKESDNQNTHTNIYVTKHQAISMPTERTTKQYTYTQRRETTYHNIQVRSN